MSLISFIFAGVCKLDSAGGRRKVFLCGGQRPDPSLTG